MGFDQEGDKKTTMAPLTSLAGLLSLTSTSKPMMREHEMSKLRHFSSPSRGMLSALLHLARKSEANLATSGRYDTIASFENPCNGQPFVVPCNLWQRCHAYAVTFVMAELGAEMMTVKCGQTLIPAAILQE